MDVPQQSSCRFNHKHVYLLGHLDPVLLREMLATKIVSVELHDNDEYISNPDDAAVAIFSAGKAKFTFRDFLRKNCLQLKLRSDVFPLKRDTVDNTENLDLNTTARKGEKSVEKASPYLVNSTYAVIIANLARPIGEFDEATELALFRREQAKLEGKEADEKPTTPYNESVRPISQSEGRPGTTLSQTTPAWNPEDAIFERLIIIIPYKSPDLVKRIEASFEKVNLLGLNLENARYLNTKDFSEAERKNRSLDFIGGFSLMDSETRMYIFEGLGGRGKGLDMFY